MAVSWLVAFVFLSVAIIEETSSSWACVHVYLSSCTYTCTRMHLCFELTSHMCVCVCGFSCPSYSFAESRFSKNYKLLFTCVCMCESVCTFMYEGIYFQRHSRPHILILNFSLLTAEVSINGEWKKILNSLYTYITATFHCITYSSNICEVKD